MAHLLLRGIPLGPASWDLEAVLFDKDGTMSHSEPMLQALAGARVNQCLSLAATWLPDPRQVEELRDLLERAYGFVAGSVDPAGTTAVASREHNHIATATALVQMGLSWPDALVLSDQVFERTDGLHGQGSRHRPQPTPGLPALLAALRQAGVGCAVISNDQEEGIRAFLAEHGLEDRFQGLWSAGHRPCKPDPAAVHGLCDELGVDPRRCALIGDANSDLRMARAAGVPVVLGYRAGWQQPPPLDPDVPQLQHWSELQVGAGATPAPAGPDGHGVHSHRSAPA